MAALYKHLSPVDNSLLDPHGPLSSKIEPSVISEVNRQVTAVQEQTNKRGEYLKFSDDEKATVACYASENGVAAAIRHFKRSKGMIPLSGIGRRLISHHKRMSLPPSFRPHPRITN